MTSTEIEIALMEHFGIRTNLIVPNVSWGMLPYEADLVILTKSNYGTEIEIKISKSDLKRDREKNHSHNSELFKYFYFAVPEELEEFALQEIPLHAGLFVIKHQPKSSKKYWVSLSRPPATSKYFRKWESSERLKLAELGCMRILGLKRKLIIKE